MCIWSDAQTSQITSVDQYARKNIYGGLGGGSSGDAVEGIEDCGDLVLGLIEEEEGTW